MSTQDHKDPADYVQEGNGTTKAKLAADAHLAEQIYNAVRTTGHLSLHGLRIIVTDGLVILRGTLSSYYLKQVVHTVARTVPGVCQVQDELLVNRPCLESD